jgi:hypothetical protein
MSLYLIQKLPWRAAELYYIRAFAAGFYYFFIIILLRGEAQLANIFLVA